MELLRPVTAPPFCPNPACDFHRDSRGWRYKKAGFFRRQARPRKIQRYRCSRCRRSFSSQTFSPTYWLRRPELLPVVFHRMQSCSGFRQVARELGLSFTLVQRQTERLGRHCLLLHEGLRPKGPLQEPLVLDGFESFAESQFTPTHHHLAVGAESHFLYGFTESELRRKGRMTRWQKRRRAERERLYGRPPPRAIEDDVRRLLELVIPAGTGCQLRSDEHPAYRRALARLASRSICHATTPSTAPRTPQNPLFPVNLADLLIRHSSANHKRETIAFSKTRSGAIGRLAIFLVWRNYAKSFSEQTQGETPAQALGLLDRKCTVEELLARRLFPSRIALPQPWDAYYDGRVPTRRFARTREHRARYTA